MQLLVLMQVTGKILWACLPFAYLIGHVGSPDQKDLSHLPKSIERHVKTIRNRIRDEARGICHKCRQRCGGDCDRI